LAETALTTTGSTSPLNLARCTTTHDAVTVYRNLVRPLLFRCDPEWVHDQSIRCCALAGSAAPFRRLISRLCVFSDERLVTDIAGLHFPNPVGMAAGYDKNCRAIAVMAALGFGFVEIGSVSAGPSRGNPKPRLWRLPDDKAICVHYGLPNEGAEEIARRLAGGHWPVPLGINIVNTNRGLRELPGDDESIISDYLRSVRLLQEHGDYLCLNLSCPNTELGRDFFSDAARLAELLTRLEELKVARPVFLKISPAGGIASIERLLEVVEPFRFVSGFMFNLPPGKPAGLRTPRAVWEGLPGAVAGVPARSVLLECVHQLYRRMDRSRYRLIAAGGIFTARDAYEFIRAGASLVQVFTALVYEGPMIIGRINCDLCGLLEREGFKRIGEAVGVETP
jgi:dihydroorotate dehydrogenase